MKYKIIGNKKIDDSKPGDVIEIDDEVKAQALIAGGHIAIIKKPAKGKK